MNKYMNFQVNKALENARKRRRKQFWISIIQMVAILTALSLLFTFLINVVWAMPVDEEATPPSRQEATPLQKERIIALEEKEMIPMEKVEKVTEVVTKETPDFPYKKKLTLPLEHQKYLYERCVALGLDFDKVLAVMEHESKFDSNAIGETHDYGYFQVNITNHKWLADEVGTANEPLNPYVNIDWGTYMLHDLYDYWTEKGYTGQALDEAVWSSYNKGINGFRKTGKATEYVSKVKESLELVKQASL